MSIHSTKFIILIGLLSLQNAGAANLPTETRLRDPRVICIDKAEDLVGTKWLFTSPNFNATPPYAETSRDLPLEIVQGKLDGQGIFYNSGGDPPIFFSMVLNEYPDNQASKPIYIYVKYYVHIVDATGPKIYVMPAINAQEWPNQYLDASRPNAGDFAWREELIELHGGTTWNTYFNVKDFGENDYFFLDKIYLSEGYSVNNFSDMNRLCQN